MMKSIEWFSYVRENNITKIQEYLNNGWNINTQEECNGYTGLHWSFLYYNFYISEFLLKNNIDWKIKNIKNKIAFDLIDFNKITVKKETLISFDKLIKYYYNKEKAKQLLKK